MLSRCTHGSGRVGRPPRIGLGSGVRIAAAPDTAVTRRVPSSAAVAMSTMRHNRDVTKTPQPQATNSGSASTDLPTINFTQRTLDNGLRVIVAPDHLAPVVAINIWYVVGSRHEQPGRTGFAHLFEHFMFQGSRHVTKAEHFSLIQSAGGVNNATTYFDRTNYFETLPSHQLELALWLEADRMATLLDALDQENLDNQREVVKNEKRQSYDNRPYGSFYEKLMAMVFPVEHPYNHTPIGSMEDLNAASVEDVITFFRTWYAPEQRGPVDRRRRRRGRGACRRGALLRAHPGQSEHSPARAGRHRAGHRRRDARNRAGQRAARRASTSASVARRSGRTEFDALEVCFADPRRWPRLASLPHARARKARSLRTSRRSACRSSMAQVFFGGWVTVRPDSDAETCERAFLAELQKLVDEPVTDDELARARALIEASELGALSRVEEVADRFSMYAALFDDPELVNEQLPHYLAVTAARHPERGREPCSEPTTAWC